MKKAIIGSGGFGREVKRLLLDNNPIEIIDFFVDDEYVNEYSKPISSLDINEYEVVCVFASNQINKRNEEDFDAETMVTIMNIHSLEEKLDFKINIVAEILSDKNVLIFENINIDDFLVSNFLVARILSRELNIMNKDFPIYKKLENTKIYDISNTIEIHSIFDALLFFPLIIILN
jgi:hypothetical protein